MGAIIYVVRPSIVAARTSAIASVGRGGASTASMPASKLNFTIPKCVPVPGPVEPNLNSPGFNFAAAMSSRRVVMPADFARDEYVGLVGERSDRDEIPSTGHKEGSSRALHCMHERWCLSTACSRRPATSRPMRVRSWRPRRGWFFNCHGLAPQLRKFCGQGTGQQVGPPPARTGRLCAPAWPDRPVWTRPRLVRFSPCPHVFQHTQREEARAT